MWTLFPDRKSYILQFCCNLGSALKVLVREINPPPPHSVSFWASKYFKFSTTKTGLFSFSWLPITDKVWKWYCCRMMDYVLKYWWDILYLQLFLSKWFSYRESVWSGLNGHFTIHYLSGKWILLFSNFILLLFDQLLERAFSHLAIIISLSRCDAEHS